MAALSSFLAVCLAVVATVSQAQLCPRANTPVKSALVEDAKSVLDGNWVATMNSTLPSPNLYPHQWSWDSAFIAIGYSHYDTRKAIDEMNALFRGQWQNGNVPHIVFNPSAIESYFPGPDFWKIYLAGENGPVDAYTSGITQPPVHAVASLAIYENARTPESKAEAFEHLREIYPKLVAWHDYLYNDRDPLKHGLAFIRHMWESGMDNSPAWDDVLDRMVLKEGDVPAYQRVDKGKVGHANERPNEYFYDRAVYLIKLSYENAYNERRIFDVCPFLIEDVMFNAILAKAGEALAQIAELLGKPMEAGVHRARSQWTASAITERLYNEEDGFFYNFDLHTGKQIRVPISGGLAGVYGAKMDRKQVNAIVRALKQPGFLREDLSAWTIPSVSRDHPSYTNTTYWKGPAWINVNYLVRDGLVRNAHGNREALKIADNLRDRSLELMRKSGFYEYFNTMSGSPHGGHHFSWSAALSIDWVCANDNVNMVSWLWHYLEVFGMVLAAVVVVAGAGVLASRMWAGKAVPQEEGMACDAVVKQLDEPIVQRNNLRLRSGRRSTHRRRHV